MIADPRRDSESMDARRRAFLKTSAAAMLAAPFVDLRAARAGAAAAGDEEIRIALIGCGGRGTGAAWNALATAGKTRLVAVADAFEDRLNDSLSNLQQNFADKVDVPAERRFVGFDAYQKAIDCGVDLVLLTAPPGFRPMHFEHAVKQGKHVFMEKPVAVDGPGVRQVLAAAEQAKAKDLKVGVGLQRHHDPRYLETISRIHGGAIGDVVLLRVYWNGAGVWVRPRQQGQTEMEYQMRNWYYFNWLCGDHIVEQHIHNLDVGNWVMQGYPVEAQGQGGRQVRTGADHGEIYDHHMVEYTYANGTKMLSQCRHIPGTWENVSEHAHGTKGRSDISAARIWSSEAKDGKGDWRYRGDGADPYQVEHDRLFAAIRQGTPFSEAENGAYSSLTSILGRMATYSGQVVTWEQALKSELALRPTAYAFDADPPSKPDSNGRYPIATPGQSRAL